MEKYKILEGKKGEDIGVEYLKKLNYRIIERNFRTNFGEIDIIAMDGDTLVFVEVRLRNSDKFGSPSSSIGRKKQKQLSKAALCYFRKKNTREIDARFDVISIEKVNSGHNIELLKNAFELCFNE